ncbi:GTP-binding protein [Thioalkalivibrio sp.]|uniref:CobW family GTP-binding protein n=1 Tax=Thioalkalivibrio sp. TaxID=2093813 RepID=UPI0012D5949D|nr:GTP-binding protein [Thioalkalivibrio sp.]TVP78916.1 MAG: GTP-binding protein [Thioalkalivibrio sp.]
MSDPHALFSRPRPIPTHLITGFLGVGKTTAIRRLLERRPKDERWAVLVNEFGEVGVDAELLADGEVAVRQVAGGCLCCVASQAFTVGLNHIIRRERPQRILIEPTGLGHPAQVIETLTGTLYASVLELHATITLMDARHLASARHRAHETWCDQIHLADVLVANKADLYTEQDREAFFEFARALDPPKLRTALVSRGDLDPAWLDLPLSAARRALFPEAHAFLTAHRLKTSESGDPQPLETDRPEWWTAESRGEGHFGRSWRFGPTVQFEPMRLDETLRRDAWDRVKGVVATSTGWVSINRVAGVGGLEPHPGAAEGRLEIIDHRPLDGEVIDRELLAARRPVAP